MNLRSPRWVPDEKVTSLHFHSHKAASMSPIGSCRLDKGQGFTSVVSGSVLRLDTPLAPWPSELWVSRRIIDVAVQCKCKSMSYAYCCEFGVVCESSQRTTAAGQLWVLVHQRNSDSERTGRRRTADAMGVQLARSWLVDVRMLQRIAERD